MDEYVSMGEAASILGVSRQTIWAMARDGRIRAAANPYSKRGKIIARSSLDTVPVRGRATRRALLARTVPPGYITLDDAARILGVQRRSVPEWLNIGSVTLLRHAQDARCMIVRRSEVEELRHWMRSEFPERFAVAV